MDDANSPPDTSWIANKPNSGWLPEMRAGLSGVLLWSAFPPTGFWWMAWVALVPWFGVWVDHPQLSFRRTLRVALTGGLAFWVLAIQWVRLSDPSAWPGWLVMSLVLAVWWPIMAVLVRRLYIRNRWPLWVVWPAVWGFQEISREYYLTGFPWYHVAHTQFRQTWLIQISDIGGASMLSLLLVAVQALVAEWFFAGQWTWMNAPKCWRRGVMVALSSLLLTVVYGQVRILTAQFKPGPTLALLQSDVPQSRRLNPNHDDLLNIYRGLIQKAIKSEKSLDLIIWPETSFPFPMIVADPKLDENGIKTVLGEYVPKEAVEDWFINRNQSQAMMDAWATQSQTPMVVGATAWDLSPSGFRKYNTAALFEPGQAAQYYYKTHLVPFGEYIPWTESLPFIAELAPFPPDQRPNMNHGDRPRVLTLKKLWHMAPLICFEDTVPHVVRRFFTNSGESPGPGRVDFFMNITNDGWFRGSEEHEVHLCASVFRCIENRTPMVRAANTGISSIIDGNGRIVKELPAAVEDVLIETVPLDARFSLYRLCGDLTGFFSSLLCLLGWFWSKNSYSLKAAYG
ncbi:MAG: apolipoprotein N-acyltransferase [Planctomycetota bacterium]